MSTRLTGITYLPTRGLDLQRPVHMIPYDMASGGYDWVVVDGSKIAKRDGYEKVNEVQNVASAQFTMMKTLALSNGTNYQLVQASSSVLLDQNGTITATAINSQNFSNPWDYAQFLDRGIFVNSSAVPFTWDGTSSASVSSAPSAAVSCCVHLNQLYLFIKDSSSFSYSAIGDIYTYTGANTDTVNVEQNNGQNIVGGRSFARNELMLFKENSMFKQIGTSKSNFNVVMVDDSVGNSCIRATQNFKSSSQGALMIWPYIDGIYIYDGLAVRKISMYINKFWDTLNKTRLKWCDAVVDIDNGRYLLSVPEGSETSNTKVICVDLLHPWSDDNGLHMPITIYTIAAQSFNLERSSSTNAQRIVFGSDNGYKYLFSTAKSDDGTSIDSYFVSPLFTFEDGLGNENCLRRIYTSYETTAGEIDYYANNKDSDLAEDWKLLKSLMISGDTAAIGVDFTIGVSPIGTLRASFSDRVDAKVRGRRIKIKIEQDSATRGYTLNAPIELYFKQGGQRS